MTVLATHCIHTGLRVTLSFNAQDGTTPYPDVKWGNLNKHIRLFKESEVFLKEAEKNAFKQWTEQEVRGVLYFKEPHESKKILTGARLRVFPFTFFASLIMSCFQVCRAFSQPLSSTHVTCSFFYNAAREREDLVQFLEAQAENQATTGSSETVSGSRSNVCTCIHSP